MDYNLNNLPSTKHTIQVSLYLRATNERYLKSEIATLRVLPCFDIIWYYNCTSKFAYKIFFMKGVNEKTGSLAVSGNVLSCAGHSRRKQSR